jgi:hypothetical protein
MQKQTDSVQVPATSAFRNGAVVTTMVNATPAPLPKER